ncbi:uncharacterized protein BXIN_2726 [Babesia sp. Xinjiang]|uniref:uncharacterized protein n=1 Tax=Babesia sp. Xinjiang TaxID=462227 RepID=UPI000A22992D|nr:uncharacterized protein BXIN_2726 [Babesia sp. Xinjiang]ORM41696.1 hypothetical protein BXIN_2726 [Babesia sp. Xinjiang]
MSNLSAHNVGDIWLRSTEARVSLKSVLGGIDDSIVKIEFERCIPRHIMPQDVLEALTLSHINGDVATIIVNGLTLHCKFVKPKAITFIVNDKPNSSVDVTDHFIGTLFVFPPNAELHTPPEVSH